jgi:hypothetical protein
LITKRIFNYTAYRIAVLLCIGIPAAIFWRKAETAGDHSAHAALASDICGQLAAISGGEAYPKSLSKLRLTYPDGGDASLLRRFTYTSSVTNCTLRTRIGTGEVLRSFP